MKQLSKRKFAAENDEDKENKKHQEYEQIIKNKFETPTARQNRAWHEMLVEARKKDKDLTTDIADKRPVDQPDPLRCTSDDACSYKNNKLSSKYMIGDRWCPKCAIKIAEKRLAQ